MSFSDRPLTVTLSDDDDPIDLLVIVMFAYNESMLTVTLLRSIDIVKSVFLNGVTVTGECVVH